MGRTTSAAGGAGKEEAGEVSICVREEAGDGELVVERLRPPLTSRRRRGALLSSSGRRSRRGALLTSSGRRRG
jgi:hypothetical protein